jgi:hypothetical protein
MVRFCREHLDCSPQFFSMILHGTRRASPRFVRAAAKVLGWPTLQLGLMFGYLPKSLRDLAMADPKRAHAILSAALAEEGLPERRRQTLPSWRRF